MPKEIRIYRKPQVFKKKIPELKQNIIIINNRT